MKEEGTPISDDVIRNLARLSRIDVEADEIARLRTEVGDIVRTIKHLTSLNVEGVEPTLHPVLLHGNVRADEVADLLDKDTFLAGAPESNEDGVLVPRVVG